MKKFSFTLEKVLKHKERLYDIAKADHSKALKTLQQEEAKLHALRERYAKCLNDLSGKMKKHFYIRELGPYYRYMTFTKREIAGQSKIVCEAIEEEESKRCLLMEAAKEKEALVKLKEKQYAEYMYKVNKEQQDLLDELGSIKHARTKRGDIRV